MLKETKGDARKNLLELEKLVKKILRKSLKDNTLDYTVQITVSSLEPGKIKYAAQISSPASGVQPISFIHERFEDLKAALVESEKQIDQEKIERTFHRSRIQTYKTKIEAHEARIKQIDEGEPEDEIPMEEV